MNRLCRLGWHKWKFFIKAKPYQKTRLEFPFHSFYCIVRACEKCYKQEQITQYEDLSSPTEWTADKEQAEDFWGSLHEIEND